MEAMPSRYIYTIIMLLCYRRSGFYLAYPEIPDLLNPRERCSR